jgi:hypothetical protein
MSNIGIVILATNAYFVLGIKFIKRFMHHYRGESNIKFYFFSDTNPLDYLPGNIDVKYFHTIHTSWVDGTNDKFKSIISLENEDIDYIYYFDADTSISRDFTEQWFIGDLVGGEHHGNRSWLKDGSSFDKNPNSKAYVDLSTGLPTTYYYGAFFGGKRDNLISFCKTLREWQLEDKKIPYEPIWNDESYINAYFHHNPPTIVPCDKFGFEISHKGGIGETRDTKLDITNLKNQMLINKNNLIDILNGELKIW